MAYRFGIPKPEFVGSMSKTQIMFYITALCKEEDPAETTPTVTEESIRATDESLADIGRSE